MFYSNSGVLFYSNSGAGGWLFDSTTLQACNVVFPEKNVFLMKENKFKSVKPGRVKTCSTPLTRERGVGERVWGGRG